MDTENFTSHPYFHFGYLERILIRSWQIQSIAGDLTKKGPKIFDRFRLLGLIIACIGAFIVAYLLEALNIFFYSMNLPRISLKSTKFREMLHVKSESRQNSSESIQESITSVDASLAAIHHCDKPPLPELQNPAKILENIVLFYDRYVSTLILNATQI